MNIETKINDLVATRVMGWKKVKTWKSPAYVTDMGLAWQVVERMLPEWGIVICGVGNTWNVVIAKRTDIGEGPRFEVQGETAPQAICIAVLKANGVEF